MLTKAFPAGIRRVREHRARGHKTLLITGALDVVIEPLRPLFDEVICARLGTKSGRFTGELLEAPPTGEARALIMADFARAHGIDLEQSVAYADSASDLPMLEASGHPVAVNPETKLAAIARKRGWHVEHWPRAPEGPRPLLPIGPRRIGAGPDPALMKALQMERSVARFAAARVASGWKPGGGGRAGPLRLVDVDPPVPPGAGLAGGPAPAVGDLRERPDHGGRPLVAVVRADRQLPVRARPRGGRRRRGRPAGGRGSRCCTAGCAASTRPARPCAAGRTNHCERLVAGHLQARPADRILRRHRRRLVAGPGRPRPAAARGARRLAATRPRS